MGIQVISNLNYPIGNIINLELQTSYDTHIAVAFLKYTGVKVIERSLMLGIENGSNIEIIVGLDFKTTDPKALKYFIELGSEFKNVSLYCYGDRDKNKTDIVFHPKIYLFEGKKEKTCIVGSTNLTGGGLTSNFEVNAIFKEKKPEYFPQFQAIYNSIKYTDSVFMPNMEYLYGYSDIYHAFERNEEKALKDKGLKNTIKEIKKKEEELPGPLPSIKSMIIELIREKNKNGIEYVSLLEIYVELEKKIKEIKIQDKYKLDTFRNSIRGELNTHEIKSSHKNNKKLFIRSTKRKGFYKLSNNGAKFKGR